MQPESPYRYTHMLGACQVGKAWAAVDGQGRFATVAVLDGVAASDQRWRDAFANAANALAQADGGQTFAASDFSTAHPWVAYTAEQGHAPQRLFQSLGLDYRPVPDLPISAPPVSGAPASVPQQVSGPPQQVSGPPKPASAVPELVSEMPQLPWAVHTTPVSGHPAPTTPQPVSGAPTSPTPTYSALPATAVPQPVSAAPQSPAHGDAAGGVPPYDPFATPNRRITPSPPRQRRTGLWVGIAALVLVIVAGGGAFAWTGLRGTTPPPVGPSPTVAESGLSGWPSAAPQHPGLEPPRPGDWPRWQVFGAGDAVRTLKPDGLGFEFVAPDSWNCTPGGSSEDELKHNCGASIGDGSQIGGELIVRNCPDCKEEQRVALRKAEEAWGLQWRSGGEYVVLAETLKLDGSDRYGIVVVAFWRSQPDGAIDRQLVLRMSAPVAWVDVIRRVVNSIRDSAGF